MKDICNYTRNDLVCIAKRENNTRRPYLLVDPIQGKHIPISPTKSLALFESLATKLYSTYPNERLLIIGFAETATAIGASIACYSPIDTYYIHTTREIIPNANYLFFSESHSHATEQKLVKNHLTMMIENTDRIVFAEDEVTTGNTILNIINLIKKEYCTLQLNFGIVSILNGMSQLIFDDFSKNQIQCTCLLRLIDEDYTDIISTYSYDKALCHKLSYMESNINTETIKGHVNPRLGVQTQSYLSTCEILFSKMINHFKANSLDNKKVLVLGTEEFMFPAMYCGYNLEKNCSCKSVHFHATTRSPILPSSDKDYPLFSRYELRSVYDEYRTTFVYNLATYDKVIIIHDSISNSNKGLCSLISALNENNCTDITIFKWSD